MDFTSTASDISPDSVDPCSHLSFVCKGYSALMARLGSSPMWMAPRSLTGLSLLRVSVASWFATVSRATPSSYPVHPCSLCTSTSPSPVRCTFLSPILSSLEVHTPASTFFSLHSLLLSFLSRAGLLFSPCLRGLWMRSPFPSNAFTTFSTSSPLDSPSL